MTLVALLLSTVQSSQADDEDGPEFYEGMPDRTFGQWANASQGGLSYARRAKQWFRTPIQMVAAEWSLLSYPDADKMGIRAEGYFISPKGAPENYGYSEPMTVRSVGFGLMPVEATVQISQRRENGYPVPVKIVIGGKVDRIPMDGGIQADMTYWAGEVKDAFNVQVLSVKVDGVDLGLNGSCRTVEPAPVHVTSPEYTIDFSNRSAGYEDEWYRTHDPSTYWSPTKGGELRGSITIPPFTGCTTTAGDDLSRLLTLSVSGPDNPVVARTGWQCPFVLDGVYAPAPPGVSNPGLGGGHLPGLGLDPDYCPGVKPFEYPERDDR